MNSLFVVCWVLLYQPVADQENCTPPLRYFSAQAVMDHVLKAGDTIMLSIISGADAEEAGSQIKTNEPGDSSGVTFVKGLIGIAILIGVYTAFKRRGWLDNDNDYENAYRPKRRPREPSS